MRHCIITLPSRVPLALLGMVGAIHFAPEAPAAPRSSASYGVPTESADAGGRRATSTSYTSDGSLGGVAGISTVAAPAETAKHGYLGQLYEVTALQLTASPLTINETATRQLSAAQLLDDATTINLLATSVNWSVLSGPLSSISTGGLATAATVYQDTAATAQGGYAGNIGTLGLTVLDTIADNFGTYAGDGLGDDWQVQYFGLNNPAAAPTADADHDGQNNLFEFTAGLVPTDAASKFSHHIETVPGQPLQKRIIFSPRLVSRTYSILTSTTLATGSWSVLTGTTTSDNGAERTVTDTNASGPGKFYQVQIVKP